MWPCSDFTILPTSIKMTRDFIPETGKQNIHMNFYLAAMTIKSNFEWQYGGGYDVCVWKDLCINQSIDAQPIGACACLLAIKRSYFEVCVKGRYFRMKLFYFGICLEDLWSMECVEIVSNSFFKSSLFVWWAFSMLNELWYNMTWFRV